MSLLTWLRKATTEEPPQRAGHELRRLAPERTAPVGPYYCIYDKCARALEGFQLNQLAYGCLLDIPAIPFGDLPPEGQKRIQEGSLGRCPHHASNPLAALCPDCSRPVYTASHVGLWAPPFSGKTVSLVAYNRELKNSLTAVTGIGARRHYNIDGFPEIDPSTGYLPSKTTLDDHHSFRIVLSRTGWMTSHRINLVDMMGETFEGLTSEAAEEKKRRRQQLMWETRQAIYLIDPETSEGLSAKIDRTIEEPLKRIFQVYKERQVIRDLSEADKNELLQKQLTILRVRRYPPGGADASGRYSDLARRLADDACTYVQTRLGHKGPPLPAREAESLREKQVDSLVTPLSEQLTYVAQFKRPTAETQLTELMDFLDLWKFPKLPDGRFDLRLALTVTKSDLLRCELPDHKQTMNGLRVDSPWTSWLSRLEQLSQAGCRVLEQYEEPLVAMTRQHFVRVGFFFTSSLGRPIEYMVNERGDVRSRVGVGPDGARAPAPDGVLWPLLWAIGDGLS